MMDFIINCIFWVCALYGLIEIIKTIFCIHSCNKINIEGFLRSLNFRILYGKEDCIENIIVLDLNSDDNTKNIIENFSADYSTVKVLNWKEFEELFSPEK